MRRTLLDRLEKLEKHPRLQLPPPPSAEDLLFQEKRRELLGQMDPKYAKIICEDMRPGGAWSALTMAFICRLFDHLEQGTPLAFPAAVAEAYLLNPKAGEDGECEACGYKLPLELSPMCPVCGRGPVSHYYVASAHRSLR